MGDTVVVTPGTEGEAEVTEEVTEAVTEVAETVAEAVTEVAETVAEAVAEAVGDAGGEAGHEHELHERVALLEERLGGHDHFDYVTHTQLGDLVEGRLNEAVAEVVEAVVEATDEVTDEAPELTIVEPDVQEEDTAKGGLLRRLW